MPLHWLAFQMVEAAYSGTAKNFSRRTRGSTLRMARASKPHAGPHHEGIFITLTHIHTLDGGVCQGTRIFLQASGIRPGERRQTKFLRPDVGCACRQDAQGGLGTEQSTGDLANGAIPTDGKGRIIFLGRSLPAELDGMIAVPGGNNLNPPASLDQFCLDGFQERLDRETSRRRVVDDQRFTHAANYTALTRPRTPSLKFVLSYEYGEGPGGGGGSNVIIDSAMQEGTLLNNRYQLLQQVGSGGMADVFRARDSMLERYVAIKVLRADYTENKSFQERFRQEARAAANLSHPNIVTVHDFGLDRGQLFIVMEHVPGSDLKTLLRQRGRFSVEEAIPLIVQACAGIGYAHRAGLVHCDVKPHNMLVTPDKRLKVTDFGIARALATIHPGERSDVVWGSPQYFSPEQAAGELAFPGFGCLFTGDRAI